MAIHLLTKEFVNNCACTAISKKTGLPVDKVRYSDGGNLYLYVTASGAKSWVFIYFDALTGKQREKGLGSLLFVSLAQARKKAEEDRVMMGRDLSPLTEKLKAKIGKVTFRMMLELTIKKTKPSWKAKDGVYAQEADWRGKVDTHAAVLLDMPLGRITDTIVAEVIDPIWHDKRTTADRLRWLIEEVFKTAIANPAISHYYGTNPALNVAAKLGKRTKLKVNKQPSLHYSKVPAAIAKLLADGCMKAKASVFCTLTATRSDEARLMQWSEINWTDKMWIVPGERMKVENENDLDGDHYVPLSDAAIKVLRSITPVVGNPFVFAGQKAGQAISEGALNVCIAGTKRKGGILFLQGEATQHGMRSSFRTFGEEYAKLNVKALEMCLAHKVGDSDTERSYARMDLLDERRAALQVWGEHIAPAPKLALVA
jgi:integrase